MNSRMPGSLKVELEQQLASLANKQYCLVVSRGATALYLSYQTLLSLSKNKNQFEKKRIILPATLCHSPANVAVYAGFEIVFCDVRSTDYTLDPECLKRILQTVSGVIAVVSVSIFGHAPDINSISKVCKEFKVSLIDDAAQCIGGFSAGVPAGGGGDIGIYSFGHTKIIDIGWGGAIVTNDESVFKECKRLYEELPAPGDELSQLRTVYSDAYYSVEKLTNRSSALSPLFWDFPTIFKPLYIYKDDGTSQKLIELHKHLEALDQIIEQRRSNWNEYRKRIDQNDFISFPDVAEGSVPWRFTFRIKNEKRNKIVTELRSRSLHVSTWYPSLFDRFSPSDSVKDGISTPVSDVLTSEIINLWVDPHQIKRDEISIICDLINSTIQEAG